jgi:hypothetical protein
MILTSVGNGLTITTVSVCAVIVMLSIGAKSTPGLGLGDELTEAEGDMELLLEGLIELEGLRLALGEIEADAEALGLTE